MIKKGESNQPAGRPSNWEEQRRPSFAGKITQMSVLTFQMSNFCYCVFFCCKFLNFDVNFMLFSQKFNVSFVYCFERSSIP